ncbi:MAG: beta-ketoacyl synthase N-terminal-like domain-containing protein [Planctomycetota bacterium]
MRAPERVHLRGMGISCALGRGVGVCSAALEAGTVSTTPLSLPGLNEPVTMRYYRIPDGQPLFATERFDRLLAQTTREAVAAADLSRDEIERLPLFFGSSCFSVEKSETKYQAELREGSRAALTLPFVGFQHTADAIRDELGCAGETFAFNTACTASANALMIAARMIRSGWCRHALVMGIELANQTTLAGFSGLQLIAETLRPFDRRRSGIVLGEGVGAIVLSADPGASALSLTAGASNGDSYSVTAANPDGSSIAAVQVAALRQAGLDARQILGIKSHGTASPMNDTGEAAGILRVFPKPPPVCALKPYLGHTLGACGVTELILMAAALERGVFPATPGFEERDPSLDLSPAREASEASAGDYLLNYFGFGGNNTSLLLHKA